MHLDLLTGLSSEEEVSNVDYCRSVLVFFAFPTNITPKIF